MRVNFEEVGDAIHGVPGGFDVGMSFDVLEILATSLATVRRPMAVQNSNSLEGSYGGGTIDAVFLGGSGLLYTILTPKLLFSNDELRTNLNLEIGEHSSFCLIIDKIKKKSTLLNIEITKLSLLVTNSISYTNYKN